MIHIQFRTDNAAFNENPSEIQVILEELAFKLQNSRPGEKSGGTIRDSNGNSIGTWIRS